MLVEEVCWGILGLNRYQDNLTWQTTHSDPDAILDTVEEVRKVFACYSMTCSYGRGGEFVTVAVQPYSRRGVRASATMATLGVQG